MSASSTVNKIETITLHASNGMNSVSANAASIDKDVAINARIPDSVAQHGELALSPITGINAVMKRAEDFIGGSVALVLLSPVMAMVAIAIKLDSTGPALFCQSRTGRNGELIKVYKFRSMYQNGPAVFKQAEKDDPRITRIGAFLRRTSLDELPQLFNVIKGTMSLVGPRPHPVKLDEDFKFIIPSLPSRYCVKPGITGWAQINGFRGETRLLADMTSRIEHDREYIKNWSLFMDIKILAMTVFKGWTHKNAY